jgi:hypothetical protein
MHASQEGSSNKWCVTTAHIIWPLVYFYLNKGEDFIK